MWTVEGLILSFNGEPVLQMTGRSRYTQPKDRKELRARIARLLNADDDNFMKGTMELAERQRREDIHDL